ncbi:MAG: DNA polymerase III subunit epsilon [Micrococcales bacterium]|nr:DNA polymerase III subunit epsilon [Micrococcales bacterium]
MGRFGAEGRRKRYAMRLPDGPLRSFLTTPPPDPATPVDELPLLAVDFETTGLRPGQDRLLSIGFVPLEGRSIVLGGARQLLIRVDGAVGQSATVHGLTDDRLAEGEQLVDAVDELLTALRGRVLLAHYSDIEEGFLSAACERLHGAPAPACAVDTLQLQRRVLGHGWDELKGSQLRLWNARARYGLPRYRAHEALTDALACAELYLAQAEELGATTLRDLQR